MASGTPGGYGHSSSALTLPTASAAATLHHNGRLAVVFYCHVSFLYGSRHITKPAWQVVCRPNTHQKAVLLTQHVSAYLLQAITGDTGCQAVLLPLICSQSRCDQSI